MDPQCSVLLVDDVVEVVQGHRRYVKKFGEITLILDQSIERGVTAGDDAFEGVAILFEHVAKLSEHLIYLFSGGAAAEVLVGEDVADLPNVGTELPQYLVVLGGGLEQRVGVLDDGGQLLSRHRAPVVAEAQSIRELAERFLHVGAITLGDRGS